MAEFRISSQDGLDLRALAGAVIEARGWPRDRVSVWDNRSGEIIVTVDDALLTPPSSDPLRATVHTRSDVHQACELLKHQESSLRHVPFTDLHAEAARFFAAGWSTADLVHALRHARDGTAWPDTAEYHAEGAGWLRHRLHNWRTPDGDIRPSVSQESAALRIVGNAGLPENIGLPQERAGDGPPAAPATARAAADDARRLMRAHSRTTSNTLAHRERTANSIHAPKD